MKEQSRPRPAGPTHAGGVVYRERGDQVEYLLVRATGPLREWVLPKGHIEAGEGARDAAVREVHEEAGIAAQVTDELDTVEFTLREKQVITRYYLMKALRDDSRRNPDGPHSEERRECAWLPLEQARERLSFDAYRTLLTLAERKRRGS
jgi:8-oxo-dGTP pyrophosphatase MutT (NUDIX family)